MNENKATRENSHKEKLIDCRESSLKEADPKQEFRPWSHLTDKPNNGSPLKAKSLLHLSLMQILPFFWSDLSLCLLALWTWANLFTWQSSVHRSFSQIRPLPFWQTRTVDCMNRRTWISGKDWVNTTKRGKKQGNCNYSFSISHKAEDCSALTCQSCEFTSIQRPTHITKSVRSDPGNNWTENSPHKFPSARILIINS